MAKYRIVEVQMLENFSHFTPQIRSWSTWYKWVNLRDSNGSEIQFYIDSAMEVIDKHKKGDIYPITRIIKYNPKP